MPRRFLRLFGLALILIFAAGIAAATTVDTQLWVANGPVNTVATNDDVSHLYVNGQFSYVDPGTGAMVMNAQTGVFDASFPQINGPVHAVVSDTAGGWYVGGQFSSVGGILRHNLAHISWDSATGWSVDDWHPDPDGTIYALDLSSNAGTLYLGGDFATVNGTTTRQYLAAVATTFPATVKVWDPTPDGIVRTLVLSADDATLYVGGDFSHVSAGSDTRHYAAAFNVDESDADYGAVLDWNPNANASVYTMTIASTARGAAMYLGGSFTQLNGGSVQRAYVAAVDLITADVDAQWDPAPNQIVRAVAVSDGRVYLGGDFSTINPANFSQAYLAAVDNATGLIDTAWRPGLDGAVYSLLVAPSVDLYVGGDFSHVNGQQRNRLVTLDLGSATVGNWQPSSWTTVYDLAGSGSNVLATGGFDHDSRRLLYIGGDFDYVSPATGGGGQVRHNLAALDLTTGQIDDWNPGVDGPVHTLLALGSTIYIGGQFSAAGGLYRQNLAALDRTTGIATAWAPDADGAVYAIRPSGNNVTLFIAGEFSRIGGQDRNGLAEVEGGNGVATGWAPALDDGARVYTLTSSGSSLYAGGDFTISDISGTTVLTRNLAALNTAGAALSQWRPAVDGAVRTVLLSPDTTRLYLGGDFTGVDGQTRNHVAALDTQAEGDGNYVLAWSADTGDVNDSVRALALSPDRTTLYIGGDFSAISDIARTNIAALRVSDATLLDNWIVHIDNGVDALSVTQDDVFVGGRFQTVEGLPRPHLASFAGLPAETDPPVTSVSLPGGNYTSATLDSIELLCDDGLGSGCATTYFALDDGGWLVYNNPLTLTEDTVLHYFSVDNVGNSEDITVNEESYILEITAPETTISPTTGVYETETLTVTLTCIDSQSGCAATYYTLDDSTPTQSSRRYTGPFKIRGKTVVKYFSVDQVGNQEDVKRASFVSSFGGSGQLGPLMFLLPGLVILVRICRACRSGGIDA